MHNPSPIDYLKYAIQNKRVLFAFAIFSLLVFATSILTIKHNYESHSVIYYHRSELSGEKNENKGLVQDAESNFLIINWVYSSKLMDYLIEEFDLMNHYKIQNTGEDAYTECVNTLNENISISNTSYGAIKIKVKDHDRLIAANIAKVIVEKIGELNKTMFVERKRAVISEHDILYKQLHSELRAERDSLSFHLAQLQLLSGGKFASNQQINNSLNQISKSSDNYSQISEDWVKTRKSMLLLLNQINESNIPFFVVIKKPQVAPEYRLLSFYNLGCGLLSLLGGLSLGIIYLSIRLRYTDSINTLLVSINNPQAEKTIIYPLVNPEIKENMGNNSQVSEQKIKPFDN